VYPQLILWIAGSMLTLVMIAAGAGAYCLLRLGGVWMLVGFLVAALAFMLGKLLWQYVLKPVLAARRRA
jgi:hypothetical protein